MRPALVSTAQIIVAGIQLKESGKAVNGFSLRKQIGSGNPARLLRIWEESAATNAGVQNDNTEDLSIKNELSDNRALSSELSSLREQLELLKRELESVKNDSTKLSSDLQQANLVLSVMTDDRNRVSMRCSELEGKDATNQKRIAELIARIDEQRGELHRGSQARITLQRALDALLPAANPNSK